MSTTLMERSTAGVEVAIHWLPTVKQVTLAVGVNGQSAAVVLAPDAVLDAFKHPMLHLSAEQVETLFPEGA